MNQMPNEEQLKELKNVLLDIAPAGCLKLYRDGADYAIPVTTGQVYRLQVALSHCFDRLAGTKVVNQQVDDTPPSGFASLPLPTPTALPFPPAYDKLMEAIHKARVHAIASDTNYPFNSAGAGAVQNLNDLCKLQLRALERGLFPPSPYQPDRLDYLA